MDFTKDILKTNTKTLFFRMKMPPLIRSPQEVKEKLQLLEVQCCLDWQLKFKFGYYIRDLSYVTYFLITFYF